MREGTERGRIDLLGDGLLAAAETPPPAGPGPAAATSPSAPLASNLCAICGSRPGRIACRNCGRRACAADSWVMLGLCSDCAADDGPARAQRRGEAEARNWLEG